MVVPRNSRIQKDIFRELKEDIEMYLEVDRFAYSLTEIEESISNAYSDGLLTGPQHDRLMYKLSGQEEF